MAESHKFRREFRGFNREDVVRYIDLLNKKNASLINQLKAENQGLKDELEALRCSEVTAVKDAQISALPSEPTDTELEAYRRAERMERSAKERSDQIYQQATAVLADAAAQVDEAAKQMAVLSDQVSQQISSLQAAVTGSKDALTSAAATMYAIRPEETEE